MPPVRHKQREKRVLRKEELKCPLCAQAGPLQQGDQLRPQLDGFRRFRHSRAHILHMVSRIRLMKSVELDPPIGDILIIVLVQEHLSPVGLVPEVSALVPAPGIGVLVAVRQGDAPALLVLRQPYILVGDSPGPFQVLLRAPEHLLRRAAGPLIAEQDVLDPFHSPDPALPVFRYIQLPCNPEHLPAGLLDFLLMPCQELVQGYPQFLPQESPVVLRVHFDGNAQIVLRRFPRRNLPAGQTVRHAAQQGAVALQRFRRPLQL